MQKPITLRDSTWQFLQQAIQNNSPNALVNLADQAGYTTQNKTHTALIEQIIDQPSPFLLAVGIIDQPELLQRTAISMPDDVEYIIDLAAAIALKHKDQLIQLPRLVDNKVFIVSHELLLKSLQDHSGAFDQLDFTDKYPEEFV